MAWHRVIKLTTAVAFQRIEDIAGQALRMNAHGTWLFSAQVAFDEHRKFFAAGETLKPDDAKLAVFGRQLRFGDALDARAGRLAIAVPYKFTAIVHGILTLIYAIKSLPDCWN